MGRGDSGGNSGPNPPTPVTPPLAGGGLPVAMTVDRKQPSTAVAADIKSNGNSAAAAAATASPELKRPATDAKGGAAAVPLASASGASMAVPPRSTAHAASTAIPGAQPDRKTPATGSSRSAAPMDVDTSSAAAAAGGRIPLTRTPSSDMKMFGDNKSYSLNDHKKLMDSRERDLMEQKTREAERRRNEEKALAAIVRTLAPFYQYQWLDVQDTQNEWLEANIVNIVDKDGKPHLHIHYKGWKDKYDELIPVAEALDPSTIFHRRLAPYLSKVVPPHPRHGNVLPREGLQVDIFDTTDKWISGDIVEVKQFRDGPMVKVRYTGWDPKYDEWLNAETYRLAPLRAFTKAELPKALRTITARDGRPALEPYRPTMDNETKFRLLLETKTNCTIVIQAGDGNCMFRSVSHQVYGNPEFHFLVRQKCMEYMRSEQAFYSQYVDGDFHMYIERMRLDGEWGDHTELQAMSEIYQRPIRVFAYSTDPYWDYKGMFEQNPPILLSYHFQSHYNSIQPLDDRWTKPQLTTQPGEWEDQQLARSRARGGRLARPGDSDGKANPNSEAAQIQRALEMSRNEFNVRDASQWESGAAGQFAQFRNNADKQLEDAKKISEQEYTQKQMLDATMAKSEEEILAKVKAASLATGGGDLDEQTKKVLAASLADAKAAGQAPQDDLARALAASLNDAKSGGGGGGGGGAAAAARAAELDLQKVMEMSRLEAERSSSRATDELTRQAMAASMADSQNVNPSILAVQNFGFALDDCVRAYSLLYDAGVAPEVLQQNMVNYLLSQKPHGA